MNKLSKITREISEDIHNRIKVSARNTVITETKNVTQRMKNIVAENKKSDTRLFKAITNKIIENDEKVEGTIYADTSIAPYANKMVTKGLPPSSIKRWKNEKEKLKNFIRKKQKFYGSFANVITKRDYERVAFFIWRKLREVGLEPFNYIYLTMLSLNGLDYYSKRVFSKFKRSIRLSLRYLKKYYKI